MTNDNANIAEAAESSGMLGAIERIGNKVPTPAIMFVYLIAGLMVLSAIVAAFDVSVTEDVAIPVPFSVLEDIQGALGGSVVPYDVITNEVVELPNYVDQRDDVRGAKLALGRRTQVLLLHVRRQLRRLRRCSGDARCNGRCRCC